MDPLCTLATDWFAACPLLYAVLVLVSTPGELRHSNTVSHLCKRGQLNLSSRRFSFLVSCPETEERSERLYYPARLAREILLAPTAKLVADLCSSRHWFVRFVRFFAKDCSHLSDRITSLYCRGLLRQIRLLAVVLQGSRRDYVWQRSWLKMIIVHTICACYFFATLGYPSL